MNAPVTAPSPAKSAAKGSPILAMTAKAAALRAEGRDIIDLTLGEPDFEPPPHVIEAVFALLGKRKLGYTPANGMPELRAAIRRSFARDRGLDYADNEIAVGCGGKQVIFNAFLATLSPGDEVIIPAPYWASYPDMVKACGGVPVIVPCGAEQKYLLAPAQLEAALTPRTRWVILNAPSNPSGAIYSAAQLQALGEVLLKHPDTLIMSDDIYAPIRFAEAGQPLAPFATLAVVAPQLKDRILTIDGVSKAYAMTGWRVGWAGGPRAVIAAINAVQTQNCTQTASLSQLAAVAALDGPQDILVERNAIYQARRDAAVAILRTCPQIEILTPPGAFYLLPRLLGAFRDGDRIADRLLEDAGVALVPGSAFGVPDHLRMSFATDETTLTEGCRRLVGFLADEAKLLS
jgi:aspartate aminotransferase